MPGLAAIPPVGGNVRTVLISIDPDLMRSHNITPQQITSAVQDNSHISAAGIVNMGKTSYLTPVNTVLSKIPDFGNIPLLYQNGATVYLRDVAKMVNGADITNGFAYVNGIK